MDQIDGFEEEEDNDNRATAGPAFLVDVEGYEGPIDVLLTLARDQKVDLTQISILELADQYLAFVAEVRRSNLELAADYLVMAAWLAYLKSRLLIPDLGGGDEPTGEEMAAALAFHLQRLESMQTAGARLMARPRLGQDFVGRGAPEPMMAVIESYVDLSLYDLLKTYGDMNRRGEDDTLHIKAWNLYSVDDALKRLRTLLGNTPDWESLWRFLPDGLSDELEIRSAIASTFTATLEMAREGHIQVRQSGPFGPIYLRSSVEGSGEPPIPGPGANTHER